MTSNDSNTKTERTPSNSTHQEHHARRRTKLTVEQGIEDYLHDHEGGNHSHYNRTFKAEQCKDVKEKKASRSSSHCCDIL